MPRAVAYCRVSTADQAAEGVSLDAQRARIAAWCGAEGLALGPADVFTDAGISGKRADNRPALQEALAAVCGSGGVLVVYSLSRLARSVRDTLQIAERLERSGADLVSLSEKIDTTTAAGKMVFRLLAVLAEFERDLISERTRGAVSHKRGRGERLGEVPYGWRPGDDGKTLVAVPEEAAALAWIGRLSRQGLGCRRIAGCLQTLGFPTKHGRPWAGSTVQGLLRRLPPRKDDDDADEPGRGPLEAQPDLPDPRVDRGPGPDPDPGGEGGRD